MIVTLTISEIGAPAQTVTTEHPGASAAIAALIAQFGADSIRGRDVSGGTIGSKNGRVFQASKTWAIRVTN
ncbi:hypothetical protein I5G67_gp084 [Mycobacterium phage Aminay]|uniref:Uncharacterized protein n=1 Tax=Mycobacterium phage Aminay TaxID=2250291 RepID=A0A345KV68_9CAUD|nr:hypothetical protein I5G67_gp084 [Mycobacterium phage Aminay]AXH46920.1 hypothetical protein SEA_AMINAY_84 [Mycobacterium phage Aminay]